MTHNKSNIQALLNQHLLFIDTAILLEKVDTQGVTWERWLPKSMIVNNLEAGYLEIKKTA